MQLYSLKVLKHNFITISKWKIDKLENRTNILIFIHLDMKRNIEVQPAT